VFIHVLLQVPVVGSFRGAFENIRSVLEERFDVSHGLLEELLQRGVLLQSHVEDIVVSFPLTICDALYCTLRALQPTVVTLHHIQISVHCCIFSVFICLFFFVFSTWILWSDSNKCMYVCMFKTTY